MDFNKLMKQAQEMQKEMEKSEKELQDTAYTGAAGDEVSIRMNGAYEVQDVTISEALLSPDNKEMVQDMILVAVNDAVAKINNDRNAKLGNMTQGIHIPGLK